MKLNNYTQKAQEAVLSAQDLAEEMNHSQIEAIHLLAALLAQDDGVVRQIVNRIGANNHLLGQQIEEELTLAKSGWGDIPGWTIARVGQHRPRGRTRGGQDEGRFRQY